MKKSGFFIIILLVIVAVSCKKNTEHKPVNIVKSDSYLPLTTGSNWKYISVYTGITDTVTVKMTGDSIYNTSNRFFYYTAIITSATNGNQTEYFRTDVTSYPDVTEHVYFIRSQNFIYNIPTNIIGTFNVAMGDDNMQVGQSRADKLTDNGLVSGFFAQYADTLKEKNITKIVNGKTFTNVMHSHVALQLHAGLNYSDRMSFDFYLAKGVGMIEMDSYDNLNHFSGVETIIDYNIK